MVAISETWCVSGGGGGRRKVFLLLDVSNPEPPDVDSSDNLPETGRELRPSWLLWYIDESDCPGCRNPSCLSCGEGFVCSSEEEEDEKK